MKNRIWLSLAHMSGREQEFIQEAFDTNWVVPLGPNVNAFEKALRDFLIENGKLKVEDEGKQVVALSAGTAALHLGLILLGVGEGDEVICQSFTFSASANPIAYLGATPVFVELELRAITSIRRRLKRVSPIKPGRSWRYICTVSRQRWKQS